MKILLVDNGITGHHISYINAILEYCDNSKFIIVLPEQVDNVNEVQYTYYNHIEKERDLKTYLGWISEISSIAKKENVDIIHFMEGDQLYRYFGLGIEKFRNYKVIMTFHHVREGSLYDLSARIISTKVKGIIVHSKFIKELFIRKGIHNIVHIEYPQFNTLRVEKRTARQFFNITTSSPVIGCIGATRNEKGLDILLEALKFVKVPFHLLIAGKSAAFDSDFIEEHSKSYKEKVTKYLHFMDDHELSMAFCSCDIICLPYRKSFNGASGPLGEGVKLGCCIVGSDHGNLGDTIRNNHLGYTFKSEVIADLANVLDVALSHQFVLDEEYQKYRDLLNPVRFGNAYKKLYTDIGLCGNNIC